MFIYDFYELIFLVLQIAIIDLVLSGDNAAVIGMAICHLPEAQRKKAAFYGAFLAIILRIIFTVTAALLLKIPFLSVFGGVILLFITYKLLFPAHENETIATASSGTKLWQAVGIIIAADASMALDNVLGVAGASAGEPLLVCFGLLLSIPLLVWGASFVGKLMHKYPIILWIGAAILMHTAVSMILGAGSPFFVYTLSWGESVSVIAAVLVLIAGVFKIYVKKSYK